MPPAQVMDLEARLDQALEDLKSGVRPGREKGGNLDRVLPRAPAKAVLAGHRNPVTCVALHPLYSVVASSSEDATVKVRRSEENVVVGASRGCFFVVEVASVVDVVLWFFVVVVLLLIRCFCFWRFRFSTHGARHKRVRSEQGTDPQHQRARASIRGCSYGFREGRILLASDCVSKPGPLRDATRSVPVSRTSRL